ncbi:LytTR family DNA-binding domain-containing protein [Fulvivirga sp.]|uniref:LytR/AlgR family response regulator transcription factor n=1 Tax=Fulvivirga sp. TaxID=1931237 RepID=UPI0032EC0873
MNLVIVEDEKLSAERLKSLVHQIDPKIEVVGMLSSVSEATEWFRDNSPPDIVLLDIQLSDGTGFDILTTMSALPCVIFTTAYDEYALKAFKYNSIEYLLKPIDKNELETALQKFGQINRQTIYDSAFVKKIENVEKSITGEYKKRFLIKIGEQFKNIDVENIAYIYYQNGSCNVCTTDDKKLPVDYSLDQLEELLNPADFLRVNRQLIVKATAISEIHTYFNSRLLLILSPSFNEEVIVSRDRVSTFKSWMDS